VIRAPRRNARRFFQVQNVIHMSTILSENARPVSTASSRGLPAWLREPLLHFAVLGAVLFAVDYALASREDDPRVIVVDAGVDAQAIEVFKAARGRAPDKDELFALRRVWLDNEVLYREGMALGLDKGDKAIRERVIFKALSVVEANMKRPAADEAVLRKWFESNRARYDEPARYDFEEAVMAGTRAEVEVRAFADALNAGTPGDVQAGLRQFTARPHDNIVQSYGADFASALEAATPGEWRALPSREGLRVMRLKAISPARPAVFEELGGVIFQDWTDAVMAE
jgi:hypothetical protein